jgi:hypothetical protein
VTYEFHEPTFDGTTDERWTGHDWPAIADEPEAVAGHFLLCADGFPPESVGDLELAVVDRRGRLNRNALADAVYGPNGVQQLDVADELAEEIESYARDRLRDHFESMPETLQGVDKRLLAWQEETAEHSHELEQKMRTDDEARYHEVRGQQQETGAERPEKGQ